MLGKIKGYLSGLYNRFNQLLTFYSDFQFLVRKKSSDAKELKKVKIMLLMHSLEKGISFTNTKRIFGTEKAQKLCCLVNDFISKYSRDEVCVIAINILNEYLSNEHSTQDKKTRHDIEILILTNKDILQRGLTGIKWISEPPTFNKEQIIDFYNTRSSVRSFSNKEIMNQEILSAMKIAETTPSACNRQTCRVHVFRDRDVIKNILANQLGGQNWCENAKALFVITSDNNFFNGGYERYQSFIDGGLYAMNFVMGLHLNHIATCFKMYIREPKRDIEFKKITNIPQYENPIVLVLAGHYKDVPVCSPKSLRIDKYPLDEKGNIITH